jgi:hypothetical protein
MLVPAALRDKNQILAFSITKFRTPTNHLIAQAERKVPTKHNHLMYNV